MHFTNITSHIWKFWNDMQMILGSPACINWINGIPKNLDEKTFHFGFLLCHLCSPKVYDEMLVETVALIVMDKQFSLDYIQKIDVHELLAKLKPLGM